MKYKNIIKQIKEDKYHDKIPYKVNEIVNLDYLPCKTTYARIKFRNDIRDKKCKATIVDGKTTHSNKIAIFKEDLLIYLESIKNEYGE